MLCWGLLFRKSKLAIPHAASALAPAAALAYGTAMHTSPLHVTVRYLSDAARHIYESQGGLSYATPHAAGMDLRVCPPADRTEDGEEMADIVIAPGDRALIPTGIAVQPSRVDVAGFIYSRSGLGARQGLTVAQGVGVVDSDYRGEILVMLLNTSPTEQRLRRGERMAQLVFQPVLRAELSVADALDTTERGAGGFGHTGKI